MTQKLTKSEIETQERNRFNNMYKNKSVAEITVKLFKTEDSKQTSDEILMHKILRTRDEDFIKYDRGTLYMMDALLSGFVAENPERRVDFSGFLESVEKALKEK